MTQLQPIPLLLQADDAWPSWAHRLDAAGEDVQLAQVYIGILREADTLLDAAFDAGATGGELVRARAAVIDRLLAHAWSRLGLDEVHCVALLAVGGYGRGELHPQSDIDLLLLLRDAPSPESEGILSQFVTLLWDLGLQVGHSVRTLDECVAEATRDVTVITNLIERRLLAGAEPVAADLDARLGVDQVWASDRFFAAKLEEQSQRHRKFGDSAYKVEPNLKDGPGGLRDIQTIAWVCRRAFGTASLAELHERGLVTNQELAALREGREFLWRVRYALHRVAARKEERLLFDHQRRLAERFGYRDSNHNLAVEQFMQRYYRSVMELERLNEMLLQLLGEAIVDGDEPPRIQEVNRRFQLRNGYLQARDPQIFAYYPPALLEVFLILAQHPEARGISASTIRLIRNHLHLIDARFRANIVARSLFMEILRQPRGVTMALRRMNRYGVLARYLPSFELIVGRMQYDLYHAYTVDEHTLFVVRNLRRFAVPELAEELPYCHEVFQHIAKPELLYLAGLFHDIAKGRGGDHSALGAEDAQRFCLEHGLSRQDAQLVAWLVRQHLVLSLTAQRRDISDPEVVREFAASMGSSSRLDHLLLLTVADVRGTNPALWNSWKYALFVELHQSSRRLLRQGLNQAPDRAEMVEEAQNDARALLGAAGSPYWEQLGDDYFLRHTAEEIAWHSRIIDATARPAPAIAIRTFHERGATAVFVHAAHHPRLFALITSTLDQLRLDIVDARIINTLDGWTLQTFIILDRNGDPVEDPYRYKEIAATLRTRLDETDQAPPTVHLHTPRRLKQFQVPTQISFVPDRDQRWTIMEVQTADRPGLLSRIAQALTDCDVQVVSARIATVSEQADDVFFITDLEQRPIDDPARHQDIRSAIGEALELPTAA
jgi:[protein-PII] uridylyltransferase